MKSVLCAVSACLLLISNSPKARTVPLPVEVTLDSNSLHYVMGASFSPDGEWVAYSILKGSAGVVSRTESKYPCTRNRFLNGSVADILVTSVATGATKVVAGGGSYNLSPAWSPDGRYVAFASNREARNRLELWSWEVKTDSLRRVSDADILPHQLQWTPDSRKVITTGVSVIPGTIENSGCQTDERAEAKILPGQADSARVNIYESERKSRSSDAPNSDPWSLDVLLADLLLIDLDSGQTRVLDHGERIITFKLSPNGSQLAFIIWKRFERAGSQQILHDLDMVSLATGQKSVLVQDIRLNLNAAFSWSPDGSRIVYQVDGLLERKHDCYVVNALSGVVHKISGFPQWEARTVLSAPAWDSDGKNVYIVLCDAIWSAPAEGGHASKVAEVPSRHIIRLITQDDGSLWSLDGGRSAVVVTDDEAARQDGFYRVDLTTGQANVLIENGKHFWDNQVDGYLKVAPNGRAFMYSAQDSAQPIDLWIADGKLSEPHRLTHVNPQYDGYQLGTKRLIHWLSLDGQMLTGVLLLPPGYEEGKKYPMIVNVYGGVSPHYDDFGFANHAPINAHLLATRGYVVFMPDAPQHLGTPMLDLAKTVLPGVSKAVEMGIADPKRLGVLGHSYGGYSVLSLLVQTPRFGAAVMCDGFGDLISAYGQMDAKGAAFQTSITEYGQGLMGATPWESRDRYVENSPIFYLNRIETPLLIAHGSEDSVVAPFLGDEVFVGMRRLGKETVYLKYAGEGHSTFSWSRANRLDFCNRVIAWFDDQLH